MAYDLHIVKATSGEPEAIDEVLRHYGKRIRLASLENGQCLKRSLTHWTQFSEKDSEKEP
ncbi:MAG: helix-turn-helix domain-containing protein [Lachnospiraceae bacterium]|nr:helix-turn-helix domain-containing protein [Lachnospiraceae bacterium]